MSKKKKDKKPKVNKDLEGFDIKINESGEIESTLSIDEINEFLDKNVEDKKFKDIDVERVTDEEEEEEDED